MMNFFELMNQQGRHIVISEPSDHYLIREMWMEGGRLMADMPWIGATRELDMDPDEIDGHILVRLTAGQSVIVTDADGCVHYTIRQDGPWLYEIWEPSAGRTTPRVDWDLMMRLVSC